jgi:hypothetical protein
MQLKNEEEIFKEAKKLAQAVSRVKMDAIIGTPTYVRLQKLYLALDAYLIDYAEGN